MNGKTLLETYPKAADVIRKHFMDKLLESLNDADLPDDFKEFARTQDIDNDKVGGLIDAQPRGLFDVFDAHRIYIITLVAVQDIGYFNFEIRGDSGVMWYQVQLVDSRKEAEAAAVEKAFEILNNKL